MSREDRSNSLHVRRLNVELLEDRRMLATLIKALEFNVDGELPSEQSNVQFFTSGIDEMAAYSVEGGLLKQRTTGVTGNMSYNSPDNQHTGSDFTPTLGTTIDARINILDLESTGGSWGPGYGAFFAAYDGSNRYGAFFTETGVNLRTPNGRISVDFDYSGGFHTYRITSPPNSSDMSLFIDGNHMQTVESVGGSFNGFNWGDGLTPGVNGANVDWDYLRVYQGDPPPFDFAPSTAIVVPNDNVNVEGNQALNMFTGTRAYRFQQVFDASEFDSGPHRITELRFRPESIISSPPNTPNLPATITIPDIKISLSTTTGSADNLSLSFAENVGSDLTLVHSGFLEFSSDILGPATGPKEFDVIIPLQQPFIYDPSQGNLLLDVKKFLGAEANGDPNLGFFFLDAEEELADGVSMITIGGSAGGFDNDTPNQPQADTVTTRGHVVQFIGEPVDAETPNLTGHELYETLARSFVYDNRWSEDELSENNSINLGYGYTVDKIVGQVSGQNSPFGFYALGLTSDLHDPIIVFRGTEPTSVTDWIVDTDVEGVGFTQFSAHQADIFSWLDSQTSDVTLTGHSLGGALTQWTAATYTNADPSNTLGEIVTFNSPGLANETIEAFVPTRADNVRHYVTNGDLVSMAGDAFIEGKWTLSSFDDFTLLNLAHKHSLPVIADQIVDPDGIVISTKPSSLEQRPYDDTDWLNSPIFAYTDLEYYGWLLAAGAILPQGSPFSHVPSQLIFRTTTESIRQELGVFLEQYVELTPIGTIINVDLPDVTLPLPALLSVEIGNASLRYHEAPQGSSLRIQGEVSIPGLYNVTADFAGDEFIEITAGGIEVVAAISAEDIVIVPGLWEIQEVVVAIDSIADTLDVTGTATVPPGIDLDAELNFQQGQLNNLTVGFSDASLPIGTTGFNLNSAAGSLLHLAETDPTLPVFDAQVGITGGPSVDISLPSFLGGDFSAAILTLDVAAMFDRNHLTTDGTVRVLTAEVAGQEITVARIDGNAELNWSSGFFEASGTSNFLDGFVTSDALLRIDSQFNLNLFGEGQVNFPSEVAVLGDKSFGGAYALDYSNNGTGDDFFAAWATIDLGLFGSHPFGVKIWFDGRLDEILGAEDLPPIPFTPISTSEVAAATAGGNAVQFEVSPTSPWIMFTADLENSSSTATLQLVTPSGQTIDEVDTVSLSSYEIVDDLSGESRRAIYVDSPEAGTWHVCIVNEAVPGAIEYHALGGVEAPGVEVTAVTGGTQTPVQIDYSAFDGDSEATVSLFFDTDNQGFNGAPIATGLAEVDGSGSFSWTPVGVDVGDYYIYAVVDDGVNVPVLAYADSLVTIEPLPGDFNYDYDVDGSDLGIWESGFSLSSGASVANGDADRDGDVDGADFLAWQRNLTIAVPAPTSGDFDEDGDTDGADFLAWQRGLGNLYDANHLTDWQETLGEVAATPLSAASSTGAAGQADPTSAAGLSDVVLALEWPSVVSDNDEKLAVDDRSAAEAVFASAGLAENLLPARNTVLEFEGLSTGRDDTETIDEPWLANELLKRVFG